jgi:hypothetical protein
VKRYIITDLDLLLLDRQNLQIVRRYRREVIKLPDAEECNEIANAIESERGLPGCVGALDGKHFQITGIVFDSHSIVCVL